MMIETALPEGLRWDADRGRLKVLRPDLADIVLRDPHIITGVARSSETMAKLLPAEDETPSITGFFELWYTVNDHYAAFNTELRKVFTVRTASGYTALFEELADRHVAAIPASGDLAAAYFSPYLMHSTFAMMGVPEGDWPNLTKVAKLVIHLFKQQLLGVTDHGPERERAFEAVMRYLKSLTDRLLTGDADSPFLRAARNLSAITEGTWPIAALIGQLLMAGIEPMIVASSIAAREIWSDPELLRALRSGAAGPARRAGPADPARPSGAGAAAGAGPMESTGGEGAADAELPVDVGAITEEIMRQQPPFGNIFRFVHERCDCLGVPLDPGTILAIDVAAVNLAHTPAVAPARGCPVRPSAVLTFGKGTHYCLGANTARIQVAVGLRRLVAGCPSLHIDPAEVRIDTHNNLKEVRALPYTRDVARGTEPRAVTSKKG